jgi:hypothetical protein
VCGSEVNRVCTRNNNNRTALPTHAGALDSEGGPDRVRTEMNGDHLVAGLELLDVGSMSGWRCAVG